MEKKNKHIEKVKVKKLDDTLDEFYKKRMKKMRKECVGDECLINDGKEIVERVKKVYKTMDGRQLLI